MTGAGLKVVALAQVKMCHTLFFGAYLVSSLGRGTRSRQDLESILDENRFAAILDSVQTFLVLPRQNHLTAHKCAN